MELYWLLDTKDWRQRLNQFEENPSWEEAIALANYNLDIHLTHKLDTTIRRVFPTPVTPIRLAVIGSSTTSHLLPSIRIAGLRRGLWIETYETAYGQYHQELMNPNSGLYKFAPTQILIALDGYHVTSIDQITEIWNLVKESFHCPIIQQTILSVHPLLLGNNQHKFISDNLNQSLREKSITEDVDLLTCCNNWHDKSMWYYAKQEISLAAAPLYGDIVGRLIAARRGKSKKCLVLDLDNTLWGGVIGDDGIEGIVLGQGNPTGEAYVTFQHYVKELTKYGVILAICSKNDMEIAVEPFTNHSEMVLKRSDISCFVANWDDKATNLTRIATELNIGLDSMVFFDDNPLERHLVRKILPMVAVPEINDPVYYPHVLADAGYFETVSLTTEDLHRNKLYQDNLLRESFKKETNIQSYLKSLQMQLIWKEFDDNGVDRIVQLINKTNQFNLTTHRYTKANILYMMENPAYLTFQFRLIDCFGDNGMIAVVIGHYQNNNLVIDIWLMSCRVLGRQVEIAVMNIIAQEAKKLGIYQLIGNYYPTKKNAIVKDHYEKLGFINGVLDLDNYSVMASEIQVSVQI